MECPLGSQTIRNGRLTTNNTRIHDCICGPGYTGPYGPPDSLESRFFFDRACTTCDRGKYKTAFGSASCVACPPSSYTKDAASTNYSECMCNAGYTGPAHNCTPCLPGTFKDTLGSHTCSACPFDFFSGVGDGVGGATSCTKCAPNSRSPRGSALKAACKCEPGYYGSNGGPCIKCEAGKYKDTEGPVACTACAANSISLAASTARSACQCNAAYTGL